jgi:hypothetical protein
MAAWAPRRVEAECMGDDGSLWCVVAGCPWHADGAGGGVWMSIAGSVSNGFMSLSNVGATGNTAGE